jgi:hypothetical protein
VAEATMAQDMLRQMKTGEGQLEEQELLENKRLVGILDEAANRASGGQLIGAVSSFLTGVAVKPYNPSEAVGVQEQDDYFNRKYDPLTQPYGMENPPITVGAKPRSYEGGDVRRQAECGCRYSTAVCRRHGRLSCRQP